MQPIKVPGFGQMPLPKAPFHFSETPVEITPQFSLLGQDNEQRAGQVSGLLGAARRRVDQPAVCSGEDKLLSARRKCAVDGER